MDKPLGTAWRIINIIATVVLMLAFSFVLVLDFVFIFAFDDHNYGFVATIIVFLVTLFVYLKMRRSDKKTNYWKPVLLGLSFGIFIIFLMSFLYPLCGQLSGFSIIKNGVFLSLLILGASLILYFKVTHDTKAVMLFNVMLGLLIFFISIGVTSCPATFGTNCIAQPGYRCSDPILSAKTGNLTVVVGQKTNARWVTTNFVFIPAGSPTVTPEVYFSPANTATVKNGLNRDQGVVLNISIANVISPGKKFMVGDTTAGSLWAQYKTNVTGQFYYVLIATVTLKAQ